MLGISATSLPAGSIRRSADDNVVWLTTWKVRDDAGVAGLGIQLVAAPDQVEPHVAMGAVGLTPTTLPIYKALGYTVGELQHYVTPNATTDTFKLASIRVSRPAMAITTAPRRSRRQAVDRATTTFTRNRVGSADGRFSAAQDAGVFSAALRAPSHLPVYRPALFWMAVQRQA